MSPFSSSLHNFLFPLVHPFKAEIISSKHAYQILIFKNTLCLIFALENVASYCIVLFYLDWENPHAQTDNSKFPCHTAKQPNIAQWHVFSQKRCCVHMGHHPVIRASSRAGDSPVSLNVFITWYWKNQTKSIITSANLVSRSLHDARSDLRVDTAF